MLAFLLPEAAAATDTTRIIIKRDPDLTAAERADIRADADVRYVESLPLPRTEVVAAAPGDVDGALRELNADPDVVYAEPDLPRYAASDDPYFGGLWGLEAMQVPAAWTLSTGAGSTVAVVDTGVDDNHPDLAGHVLPGYDWVDDDDDADDQDGHGTHVSGTIAAIRDNGEGIAGVAPDARILPLRVLEGGDGLVSDTIRAYDYADDRGVHIVNASFGGEGFLQSEYNAIQRNPQTLFVVAAGNDGDNNDGSTPNYPCAYDLPNIVCVGASTQADGRAGFSGYGATTVDVFAPGVAIYSTDSTDPDGYRPASGTSMATPHVSGLAALLLSQNPGMTPTNIRNAVVQFADDNDALEDLSVSDGRANAYATLATVDVDGDAVPDSSDNCPTAANGSQTDSDGDGAADACDPSPRGHNNDGDHVAALDDACPDVYGTLANGCRASSATPADSDHDGRPDGADRCPVEHALSPDGCLPPQVSSLSAKGSKRGKRRSATVRVGTTRAATVRVTIERKQGRKWVRVKRATRASAGGTVTVTAKRLKKGRYRVKVSVSSASGSGTPVTKGFRVR